MFEDGGYACSSREQKALPKAVPTDVPPPGRHSPPLEKEASPTQRPAQGAWRTDAFSPKTFQNRRLGAWGSQYCPVGVGGESDPWGRHVEWEAPQGRGPFPFFLATHARFWAPRTDEANRCQHVPSVRSHSETDGKWATTLR